jgi:hypothetical protein
LINDPMDVDLYWPNVRTRDEALDALQNLLEPRDAELVWNGFLLPMYDLMRARNLYPSHGRCRCGALHPAFRTGPPRKSDEHRMWCQRYVGPLKHAEIESGIGILGSNSRCSCGKTYPSWVEVEDARPIATECPDRLLPWRGPRPNTPQEVPVSSKKKNDADEPQQAEEVAAEEQAPAEDGLSDAEREQQKIQREEAEANDGITHDVPDDASDEEIALAAEGESHNV